MAPKKVKSVTINDRKISLYILLGFITLAAIIVLSFWAFINVKADHQKRLLNERATSLNLASIGRVVFNHDSQQLDFPPVWVDVGQSIGIISKTDPQTLFSTVEEQLEKAGLQQQPSDNSCTWQDPPCPWADPSGGVGTSFFVVPSGKQMSDSWSSITKTVPLGYSGAVITL